ncbi:c-type heme family protein [Candidatus Uabimicrobium amorphum]|uniref:histidine kinase n=1 Tax=Uabimicrobium amorphum TaxID=2596890 RepID=A0A5S9IJE4_UABAM|nr:DUF3365 domain-containing protein [Candidatus Uabimicrobium amorphum]BBM82611.1 histidine kinase [Candidatus Uabimicrobium amorphum]
MHHKISAILKKHTIVILSTFSLTGVVVVVLYLSHVYQTFEENIALQNAKDYVKLLRIFRKFYTSEVVKPAKKHGMEITHDYRNKKAIPLPATLSMMIGNKLGQSSDIKTYLYSAYPFPWRKNEGLNDSFRRDAWKKITNNKEKPFYRYESANGKRVLRYASADIMHPSCVKCHNTHKHTPKSDWRVGDVRGIVEIRLPMDVFATEVNNRLFSITALIFAITILGLVGIAFIFKELRNNYLKMEQHSEKMHDEIEKHKKTEKRLIESKKLLEENTVSKTVLEESNRRYKAIIEAIPDRVIELSNCYTDTELPQIFYDYFHKAQKTQQVQFFKLRQKVEGDLRDYEVYVNVVNEDEGLAFIRDVTQKRLMENEILNISEYERKKIGQDLHDDLGQRLASIAYITNVLKDKHQKIGGDIKDFEMVEDLIRTSIEQSRTLARGLYPIEIDEHGIIGALQKLTQQTQQLYNIKCSLHVAVQEITVKSIVREHLYRIAQEAIHNAVKHSKAEKIDISLYEDEQLTLTISDNGIGFPEVMEKKHGMGLNTMRYRANRLQGDLFINSTVGKTSVICKIPRGDNNE